MIEIEIDGQKLEVEQGSMIIEAADAANIAIPRFCYHKKLSVAANCRMCLVEVEKVGKPLPACATPVTAGMKVFTKSPKAIDAQKSVMEFLLINHPLDCPICDQGGACELQDISMGYGPDISRYTEGKRSVKDENLGSLISTDMTRCIQCTRCVRFGQEIANMRELGTIGRGEHMEIGSYLKEHALKSELSGNIIDLCPVGALTSRPFRFTARAWELDQFESIAPHDCVGSNIYLQTRGNKVMRVVPRENEQINESWISDRDRFSYQGLYSSDRLTMPMIKKNNKWEEVDWTTAFDHAVSHLKAIKEQSGGHHIAALASPNSTLEEFYLLQRLMRGLGSQHIDHRLRQTDYSDQSHLPLSPALGISIEQITEQEIIFLIGSHIRHEQPIIAHRIRKAIAQGAKVICVNPVDFDFAFTPTDKKIIAPQQMAEVLADISEGKLFTEYLQSGKKILILLGALALNHPEAAVLRAYANSIAQQCGANVGYLTEGANSVGGWLAGAIPHRSAAGEVITPPGYGANAAFQNNLPAYLLLNIEPDCDCANPSLAMQALQAAECVVALTAYKSASLMACAEILLPISPYAETAGTFVNIEGRWQSFKAATLPLGESRPAWKVLRVFANLFNLPQFDYTSTIQIRDELQNLIKQMPTRSPVKLMAPKLPAISKINLQRITEWPIYRGDPVLRRGVALQSSALSEKPEIKLNAKLATELELTAGDQAYVRQNINTVILSVAIDERLPDNCVAIPGGYPETAALGAAFGAIEVGIAHD